MFLSDINASVFIMNKFVRHVHNMYTSPLRVDAEVDRRRDSRFKYIIISQFLHVTVFFNPLRAHYCLHSQYITQSLHSLLLGLAGGGYRFLLISIPAPIQT